MHGHPLGWSNGGGIGGIWGMGDEKVAEKSLDEMEKKIADEISW